MPRAGGQFWATPGGLVHDKLCALVLSPWVTNVPWSLREYVGNQGPRTMIPDDTFALAFWGYALLGGRAQVRWHRVGWLIAAFGAWAAVSTLFAESPATALMGARPGGEAGWLSLASCPGGAFLTLQLADGSGRIRVLLFAISVSAAGVAAYGLIQSMGLDPFPWGVVPWGAFRSFGTLGNPDTFGAYMALVWLVSAGLVLAHVSPRWRHRSHRVRADRHSHLHLAHSVRMAWGPGGNRVFCRALDPQA